MTETVLQSKPCLHCGAPIREKHRGDGNFKKAKFCSMACDKARYRTPEAVAARFWAKVDKSLGPNACWIWMGAITTHGYGCSQYHGRVLGAHKVAYLLTKGEVPAGMEIMHSCDSPPCVNPAHLSVGTRQDNVDDKVAKGRTPKTHRKVLKPDDVRHIRSQRGSASSGELAALYGLNQSHIFAIWGRKCWKGVE